MLRPRLGEGWRERIVMGGGAGVGTGVQASPFSLSPSQYIHSAGVVHRVSAFSALILRGPRPTPGRVGSSSNQGVGRGGERGGFSGAQNVDFSDLALAWEGLCGRILVF